VIGHLPPHLLIAMLCATATLAKPDAGAGWIDTVPPVVSIQPADTFHAKLFHITISASKQPSAIWYFMTRGTREKTAELKMERYQNPLTIMDEGKTSVYFYGEDLAGNKSKLDSMRYILDMQPPEITLDPGPGKYHSKTIVRITANKPCRFFFNSIRGDTAARPLPDSLVVNDSAVGFIRGFDRAGNIGNTAIFSYIVDTSVVQALPLPKEGIYNRPQKLSFSVGGAAEVYYSFDLSAPSQLFGKYEKPVQLPYGNTIVRYFSKGANGWASDLMQATYLIDTIAPKIHFSHAMGKEFDTIALTTKKPSIIRFTLDGRFPTEESDRYERPIVVAHKGKCVLKAVAKDRAGNISEVVDWTYKFDKNPPVVGLSSPGGLYNAPVAVRVTADKPASVFYTLDGGEPSANSLLYKDEILISKDGATVLRLIAIDEAGNVSRETAAEYVIDTKPPEVRVRVVENIKENQFAVTLTADKEARIYYEIGEAQPNFSSPVYSGAVSLRMGQTLRYFAVDKAGNRTPVKVMDDLKRPLATCYPSGGVYNHRLKVVLSATAGSSVFWRLLPDTVFTRFSDSIYLVKDGVYSLEYYSETPAGVKSPIRRTDYSLDMTPPRVSVNVKKGNNDSMTVFFECTKNATIYYTTDGSNPAYSATARTLANKFQLAQDRLSVFRKVDVKLAFFAEDLAGNQSPLTVLDVFKPQAVPNVPAGKDILYDRILSITLNTYDTRSQIFYSLHGKTPTADSTVYTGPINLVRSDTITAFVIDAAGYRGQLDTFVYLIDLPPSPRFSVFPESLSVLTPARFDASATFDHETPLNKLLFRWDFEGTGKFETDFKADPQARHTYASPGVFNATLEVKDENQRTAVFSKQVFIQASCPPVMVSVTLPGKRAFCMDKYSWPNVPGKKPLVNASWVVAKMDCIEAGKRLCTNEEWTAACKGPKKTAYPYGNTYERRRCADKSDGPAASGSFPRCGNEFGALDMVGNVWEWVDAKDGDYPLVRGGSYKFGEAANCDMVSPGSVGTRSGEVGFRCCK